MFSITRKSKTIPSVSASKMLLLCKQHSKWVYTASQRQYACSVTHIFFAACGWTFLGYWALSAFGWCDVQKSHIEYVPVTLCVFRKQTSAQQFHKSVTDRKYQKFNTKSLQFKQTQRKSLFWYKLFIYSINSFVTQILYNWLIHTVN